MKRIILIAAALLGLAGRADAQVTPQVPYTFANQNGYVPASELDSNFAYVLSTRTYKVTDFGAKCNGTTDDTGAFESAASYASSLGGGVINVPPSQCLVGTNANLDLTPYTNVAFVGQATALGYYANNATAPYTLLLNSANSIKMGAHTALIGLRIARSNITAPTTLRQAITEAGNFAGTGIIVAGETDVLLQDVQVNGFTTGISVGIVSGCVSSCATPDRFHAFRVAGDDTSFFSIDKCADNCVLEDAEAWPFVTYNTNIQPQITAVSGTSSDSGLVELALSSAPATPLVTGDSVVVYGVGGTTEADGRWTITVIDSTHLTLQGSSYVHSWTSGGDVWLGDAERTGTAFSFTGSGLGGEFTSKLVDYGHYTKIAIGPNHGPVTIHGYWCDGDTINNSFSDPTPVCINNQGYGNFDGGFISSTGISILNNNSSINRPLNISNSLITVTGCASPLPNGMGAGVTNENGPLQISNSQFAGANACAGGYDWTYVEDGTTSVSYSNVSVDSGTIRGAVAYQTQSTDCPNFSLNSVVSCVWTPVLTGMGGTATYSVQQGSYTITGGSHVVASFHLILATNPFSSGVLTVTGLPVAQMANPSSLSGTCTLSRWGGITFSSNYNVVVGQVSPSTTFVALSQLAGSGSTGGPLALTYNQASSTAEFQGVCSYQAQ